MDAQHLPDPHDPVELDQVESKLDALFDQMQAADFARGVAQVLAMDAQDLARVAPEAIANERHD